MDLEQLLLTKLAEECQEVAKVALKASQFGIDCVAPNPMNTSNRVLLTREVIDFEATLQLCRQRGMLDEDHYTEKGCREYKHYKIGVYANISLKEGRAQFNEEELAFIKKLTSEEN